MKFAAIVLLFIACVQQQAFSQQNGVNEKTQDAEAILQRQFSRPPHPGFSPVVSHSTSII